MNRRDFLKLTSLLGLVPIRKVVPMAMLSELMMKVVDGRPLSPLEREDLRQMLQEVDNNRIISSTWQRVQDKKMNTDYLDLPFVPIVSQVFEQDMAEFTLEIPAQYKHLMIMGQGRVNGTGGQTAVYVYCQYNDDTGSNYMLNLLYQAAATHNVTEDLSNAGAVFAYMTGDGGDANYNGSFVTYVPHYNSGYFKTALTIDSIARAAATSIAVWQGVWQNIAPIRKIRFFPDPAFASAKIEAGSLISVYGIQ